MSNDEEKNEEDKREAERIRWELNSIRDDLLDELDDLYDEFRDEIDDLLDESEDIKGELKEELEELEEERESLLNEIGDVREILEDLGEGAREKIEDTREKLERLKDKVHKYEYKLREKVRKKLDKARKKAVKRINISVDPEMSDEWKDWAEDLGASVSELVRKSMKFVKNNIGDIAKLEKWGKKLEKMGDKIEVAVKDSGLEDLGEKIEQSIKKGKGKVNLVIDKGNKLDKERIKKRVQGLIKLQNALPIEKFAQALKISNEEAENMIYELAAEGISGALEGGVFKFESSQDEVISKIFELIDKM
ncbi:MAG: hypothetical protein ACFFA6_10650 [Promethearchaeota archaeon]